jgi:hypothetical protein
LLQILQAAEFEFARLQFFSRIENQVDKCARDDNRFKHSETAIGGDEK